MISDYKKDFFIIGKKYSVISVDAPIGSDDLYSRRDILSLLPHSLENDFVLIFDDCDRIGEQNTISCVEKILKRNDIKYAKTILGGVTDCCVIASESYRFICSI